MRVGRPYPLSMRDHICARTRTHTVLAWTQLALFSDYLRMRVMRAMRKVVWHVFGCVALAEHTVGVMYVAAQHLPCTQHTVVPCL